MRTPVIALALASLAGCAFTAPTNAQVARYEPEGLRYCTITLGWTLEQLRERCGEPIAVVPRIGEGGDCWVYESLARPIVALTAPEARYFAVCSVENMAWKKRGPMVDSVIALTAPPASYSPAPAAAPSARPSASAPPTRTSTVRPE